MNQNDAIIRTRHQAFAFTGFSSVSASYASEPQPTATAPANVNIFTAGSATPDLNGNLLRLVPVTTSTAATGIGMRVIGWSTYTQNDGSLLWIPTVLADVTLSYTSGTKPSFSVNGTSGVTCFAAATVAAGVPTVNAYSPGTGNVNPASVVVDTIGCQRVEVQFKGSAGTMGAMWYAI